MGKTIIKSNPPETIKSLNLDRNQFEIPFKLEPLGKNEDQYGSKIGLNWREPRDWGIEMRFLARIED